MEQWTTTYLEKAGAVGSLYSLLDHRRLHCAHRDLDCYPFSREYNVSDLYQRTASFSAGQKKYPNPAFNKDQPCFLVLNTFDIGYNTKRYEVSNIEDVRNTFTSLSREIHGDLKVRLLGNQQGYLRNYGIFYFVADDIGTTGYLTGTLTGEDGIRP